MCVDQLIEAVKWGGGGGRKDLVVGALMCMCDCGALELVLRVHATEVKFRKRFTIGNKRTTTFFKNTPLFGILCNLHCTRESVLVSMHWNRMRCNFCSIRAVSSKKIEEACKTGRHIEEKKFPHV
jgi:hypothetical protein